MDSVTSWQPRKPITAIIFDCDGTLSSIEGIDALAKSTEAKTEVERLTAEAMGKTGINPTVYQQRLSIVRPTQEQITALGALYLQHIVPEVTAVIQLLQRLNKSVYIVSAGLYPAVANFGKALQIPPDNIFAVQVKFDAQGNLIDFDHTSPLINNNGKRIIVDELRQNHAELAYVGDGLNDYAVHDLVSRFIGYGGVYYREHIAELCDYYIAAVSMASLLPLVLTQQEYINLNEHEQLLYQQGLSDIRQKKVKIQQLLKN